LTLVQPAALIQHSRLREERAVPLVGTLNVMHEPVLEEVQRLDGQRDAALLETGGEILDLRDERLMLGAVCGKARIALRCHQPLFRLEVINGVFAHLLQHTADHLAAFALRHGGVQVVDQRHKPLVLLVELADVDVQAVGPLEQGHATSLRFCKVWCGSTIILAQLENRFQCR
jgi:hypothetical protein